MEMNSKDNTETNGKDNTETNSKENDGIKETISFIMPNILYNFFDTFKQFEEKKNYLSQINELECFSAWNLDERFCDRPFKFRIKPKNSDNRFPYQKPSYLPFERDYQHSYEAYKQLIRFVEDNITCTEKELAALLIKEMSQKYTRETRPGGLYHNQRLLKLLIRKLLGGTGRDGLDRRITEENIIPVISSILYASLNATRISGKREFPCKSRNKLASLNSIKDYYDRYISKSDLEIMLSGRESISSSELFPYQKNIASRNADKFKNWCKPAENTVCKVLVANYGGGKTTLLKKIGNVFPDCTKYINLVSDFYSDNSSSLLPLLEANRGKIILIDSLDTIYRKNPSLALEYQKSIVSFKEPADTENTYIIVASRDFPDLSDKFERVDLLCTDISEKELDKLYMKYSITNDNLKKLLKLPYFYRIFHSLPLENDDSRKPINSKYELLKRYYCYNTEKMLGKSHKNSAVLLIMGFLLPYYSIKVPYYKGCSDSISVLLDIAREMKQYPEYVRKFVKKSINGDISGDELAACLNESELQRILKEACMLFNLDDGRFYHESLHAFMKAFYVNTNTNLYFNHFITETVQNIKLLPKELSLEANFSSEEAILLIESFCMVCGDISRCEAEEHFETYIQPLIKELFLKRLDQDIPSYRLRLQMTAFLEELAEILQAEIYGSSNLSWSFIAKSMLLEQCGWLINLSENDYTKSDLKEYLMQSAEGLRAYSRIVERIRQDYRNRKAWPELKRFNENSEFILKGINRNNCTDDEKKHLSVIEHGKEKSILFELYDKIINGEITDTDELRLHVDKLGNNSYAMSRNLVALIMVYPCIGLRSVGYGRTPDSTVKAFVHLVEALSFDQGTFTAYTYKMLFELIILGGIRIRQFEISDDIVHLNTFGDNIYISDKSMSDDDIEEPTYAFIEKIIEEVHPYKYATSLISTYEAYYYWIRYKLTENDLYQKKAVSALADSEKSDSRFLFNWMLRKRMSNEYKTSPTSVNAEVAVETVTYVLKQIYPEYENPRCRKALDGEPNVKRILGVPDAVSFIYRLQGCIKCFAPMMPVFMREDENRLVLDKIDKRNYARIITRLPREKYNDIINIVNGYING